MNVAACAGKWELFDSTDVLDHIEAKKICATCPIRSTCDALYLDVAHASHPRGMPSGTWAGRLRGATSLDHCRNAEEQMFTDDEALAAHAAYVRGERDSRTVMGHRVWDRRYRRQRSRVA